MKYIKKISRPYWYGIAIIAFMGCCIVACRQEGINETLGALPKADFAIVAGPNPNTVIAVNKTNVPSIDYWTSSNGLSDKGDSASFHFIFEGTYTITLMAAAHGGIDTITKSVTINQNDPTACQGTVQGFIAGCSQKTWMLNPAPYAEMVGPNPGDGSWWGNSQSDVTGDRVCDWDDQWTFHFDATGTMNYDNKGDFYTENYLGNANYSCDVNADLTPVQKPWASGNFNYVIIPNAGTDPQYGQLKVVGSGAHIGLPRVTNGGDNTTAPVNSITYDIIGMKHDPAGYDLLELTITEGGGTWWTFTLRSVN